MKYRALFSLMLSLFSQPLAYGGRVVTNIDGAAESVSDPRREEILQALPEGLLLEDGGKVVGNDPEKGIIRIQSLHGEIRSIDVDATLANDPNANPSELIACIVMFWVPAAALVCAVSLVFVASAAS